MRPRIEKTHLDRRVRVELHDLAARARDAEVIEQQPDPNAAIGGLDEPAGEQLAGRILLPDEVLDIERGRGRVGQRESRIEGASIAVEQPVGRVAGLEAHRDPLRMLLQRTGRRRPRELRWRRGALVEWRASREQREPRQQRNAAPVPSDPRPRATVRIARPKSQLRCGVLRK
jgi:hypothetical protein